MAAAAGCGDRCFSRGREFRRSFSRRGAGRFGSGCGPVQVVNRPSWGGRFRLWTGNHRWNIVLTTCTILRRWLFLKIRLRAVIVLCPRLLLIRRLPCRGAISIVSAGPLPHAGERGPRRVLDRGRQEHEYASLRPCRILCRGVLLNRFSSTLWDRVLLNRFSGGKAKEGGGVRIEGVLRWRILAMGAVLDCFVRFDWQWHWRLYSTSTSPYPLFPCSEQGLLGHFGHFGPVLALILGPFWASSWTDCWAILGQFLD